VTATGRKLLIVSGDDFGAAVQVNDGIVRAHRDGILTQTSLMVTGDAAAHAVELARATPTLAVGLHLVLAQGRPAAPPHEIPELVRGDGAFRDTPIVNGLRYAWAYVRQAGRAQLVREITAQLDAFMRTGLSLAHVDGHLNMHLHPMVLPILIELAPRYGITATRMSREPLGAALRYDRRHLGRKCFEGVIFHVLAAYATPRLRAAGIVSSERVFGMHQTGHVDERYLLDVIEQLPAGVSELYAHPATSMPPVMAPFQHGYDHAGEVAGLTSPRVRAALEAAGVRLTTYRELAVQ
jgi:hopanoid biosynthesis associated protein HpnK